MPSTHVIVSDLDDPKLDAADVHHLDKVLRLRPGEQVGATDGQGGYLPCLYQGNGVLRSDGPVSRQAPRAPSLTVGFAPVKGDRPEWAVQKLTELGVDRIMLFATRRTVVRWQADRSAPHVERLRRVARSAVMQSRQCWLPKVDVLDGWRGLLVGAGDGGVALAQPGAPGIRQGVHTVLVGPEGGWSPEELAEAPSQVGLGVAVLRTETAAVAAGVLLGSLRAGLVSHRVGD